MADRTQGRHHEDPQGPDEPAAPAPDPLTPAALRSRAARRALWAGLAVSAVLHLAVWALGPDLSFPVPDALRADSGVELLPAVDEPAPPAVEVPAAPEPIARPAEPVAAESGGEAEEPAPPPFIPHDVRPRLVNAPFIQEYLQAFYPPTLRSSNLIARVRLWLFVNEEGNVEQVRVQSSSGLAPFDSLAVSAASVMDFRPALSGDQTVGVWVEQWIRFQVKPPAPEPVAVDATEGG